MGKEYEKKVTVLGSVPSLGPVVLFDDMEDLFKWVAGGTAGDRVVEKSTTVAYNGAASLHIKSRTTDAAENDSIEAERYCYQRPGKRYRLELLWKFAAAATAKRMEFNIGINNGTNFFGATLWYLVAEKKWQMKVGTGDGTAGQVDVTDGAQELAENQWHRLVMDFDESSQEFLAMVSDGLEADLSGNALYWATNAAAVKVLVEFRGVNAGAAPASYYFDDVLVMEI